MKPIVSLIDRYRDVRAATERLAEPLRPEDTVVQSMPDVSPTKWHLAHTSWFFETFVLSRADVSYRSPSPEYAVLFNSYYQAVGPQYSRPNRGLLTRPTLDEVKAYRRHVDEHMHAWLTIADTATTDLAKVVDLGLHHEQQHQELIVTDIKHVFSQSPLEPRYLASHHEPCPKPAPLGWTSYEGGLCHVGHEGNGFAYDNESPRHRVYIEPYAIASRPVTNGEYLEFIEDGGYGKANLWLSDAWATVRDQGWNAPLYWRKDDGAWTTFTLAGRRALDPSEAVCHVSFYEADAYARWAGARLPTEFEWELSAAEVEPSGNFAESRRFHPTGARDRDTPAQLFGDVWEWTQSAYAPYPGYRAPAGALGEYNGKFMCNQMVLRGGSCATPQSHIRATYRNFFFPPDRWQFSGVRLARDA